MEITKKQLKKWNKSLTIWFNVALLVIATTNDVAQIVPIPNEVLVNLALIGNILLRFKTQTGILISK